MYPVTSELRAAADPLVANLKTPLIALIGLCERAWSLRLQAADDSTDLFDSSRAVLVAGVQDAKANVSPNSGGSARAR